MIRVQNKVNKLCVVGHASQDAQSASSESHDVCVSVTALTKMLIVGLSDVVGDNPSYQVESGRFVLNKSGLSKRSFLLIEVFMRSVWDLSQHHPDYVRLYGNDGSEIRMNGVSSGIDEHQPLFPDWRDFVVDSKAR